MAEKLIELGSLRIRLGADEDAVSVLRSLMRHVSNQEIADMLGISERTVRRWKREGRLPSRGNARLKLADLLEHLAREGAPLPAAGGPNPAKGGTLSGATPPAP